MDGPIVFPKCSIFLHKYQAPKQSEDSPPCPINIILPLYTHPLKIISPFKTNHVLKQTTIKVLFKLLIV